MVVKLDRDSPAPLPARAGLHPQARVHKERLLTSPIWLCMERAKYYTEVYQATEGEHPSLRAAKAFRRTVSAMTIRVYPEELLVGNRASHFVAPPFAPEKGDFNYVFKYLLPELEAFGYRISAEDRTMLEKVILPYWEGKTIRDQKVAAFQERGLASELDLSLSALVRKQQAFGLGTILSMLLDPGEKSRWDAFKEKAKLLFRLPALLGAVKGGTADNVKGRGRVIDTQAHIVLGHRKILRLGFRGIQAQARARLEADPPADQRAFLEAVVVTCDAMRYFSERFAFLAETRALETPDPARKVELFEIARVCRRVPWKPARTFHEALQAMWFAQNAAIISYGAGSGITPGRVDQLLYPYYQRDVTAGRLSPDRALRLVEEFLVKINNNVVVWPNIAGVRLNHLGADIENITLGGVTRAGRDATNALTYLFITAIKHTKLATSASFRFHPGAPRRYVDAVTALHQHTNSPALFNDAVVIQAMQNDGYTLADARDYCLVGCVEPSGNGDTYGATGGSKFYLPSVLDLVLNRGKTTFLGHQDTRDTGDPRAFPTFSAFMDAFYAQMEEVVAAVAEATNLRDAIWAEQYHNPLISCTIKGCVETGRDMTAGGGHYKFGAIGAGGLATAVDSLAAIRKFVYEERRLTMDELVDALHHNFHGDARQVTRAMLATGPKFGNDDDAVDALAVDIVDRVCRLARGHALTHGGHFKASFISYGLNIYEGALEPATPDGRSAGAPLSNSISPANGAERQGPTAVFNSLAKIDHTQVGYGDSLNMRLPGYLVTSPKGRTVFQTLFQTYFAQGGMHVQVNTVDSATLRDAQQHPEAYADLIVRVSGYSAYFTRLGREIQDDILTRVDFTGAV